MGEGGFEPPKAVLADLQSVPFGLSGIPPNLFSSFPLLLRVKADNRTRTDNLLITNQLLCQLSYIGTNSIQIIFALLSTPYKGIISLKAMGPTGLEPVTLCL